MLCCPACLAPVRREALDLRELTACPVCRAPVGAVGFPALVRPQGAPAALAAAAEAGAACFFHPEKAAAVTCERCGRFLCALCDIDLRGEHVCSSCISSGQKKGRFQSLDNERKRYDRTALLLALSPIVFGPLSVLTAPAALYLVIRYWKAPPSLVESTRPRLVVAGVLAGLQVVAWLGLISFAVYH